MDTLNSALGAVLRGYFGLFAWAHPLLGLAVLSVLAGVGMLWLFARTSNQVAIRRAKRRVSAHLMELRLFADEPALMFRAQAQLLTANARYLALMLVPALAIAVPMLVLLVRLDAYYGRAPLPVGSQALVTLETRNALDAASPAPLLRAPEGIAVETPGVRALAERQVSWRIRALGPVSGELRIVLPEGAVEKRIESGSGQRFVPGRRASSPLAALWYPDEPLLRHTPVDWIDIDYPPAEIDFLGLRWHWLIWFTLISMLTALALKKRFRVVL
ncbi:MAG TPA: hypothetical protein VHA11_05705 [Bryobacteraceae bacterium]|nr:hypothetical protein [Bryobacteraceae bacterium]